MGDDKSGDAQKEADMLERTARAKATMLRTEIEASLKQRKAVVIISKEMESFADVIVVSSGHVMLIQCKQKLQPREKYLKKIESKDNKQSSGPVSKVDNHLPHLKTANNKDEILVNKIEWIDEIEKMCGLDSQIQSVKWQQRRADKLRNIYLDELKSA